MERVEVPYDAWLMPAQLWDRHRGQDPDLGDALRELQRAKVEYVMRCPRHLCCATTEGSEEHAHRVLVSMLGEFHAEGSEASLVAIEADVAARADNLRKLRDCGAERRHLFVALDWETDGGLSRPFRGDEVTEWDHFGLPARAPILPAEVDDLWVVFEPSGVGWHWDEAWEKVTTGYPAVVLAQD